MPLTLPNLDDRSFSDLITEMRGIIPRYSKNWTNYNPSDPGITLLELLVWLSEMVLYRLNQIDEKSYMGFMELIGLETPCPESEITFEINVAKDALPLNFVIKHGTQIAAKDALTGEDIVFETLTDIKKNEGRWDKERSLWVFETKAVNIMIEEENLGISNGSPNQIFSLVHRPIFLQRFSEDYPKNPQITLIIEKNGEKRTEPWTYKMDLLESTNIEKHFTVDPLAGVIRFGDGNHGAIPPKGWKITGTYWRPGGLKGNVGKKKIHILKSTLKGLDSSKVNIFNESPASGGMAFERLDELLAVGLDKFQERYRAVSNKDFEDLTKKAVPEKIARVKVVSGRNLEGDTLTGDGHISIIILPAFAYLNLKGNPTDRSCAEVQKGLKSSRAEILRQKIFKYLEDRRLITTRVHVVFPEFTENKLVLEVIANPGINADDLENKVKEKILTFLDPYLGWEDGKGWPFGRNVYRSELYQQVEGIEGVDHVESMAMNDDRQNSFVAIAENNLICIRNVTVRVNFK